jgi:hypothetical protein
MTVAKSLEVIFVKKTIVTMICMVLFSAVDLSAAPNDPQEEKAVLQTLDRMGQAMVNKDIAMLTNVLHDDLTWGHSTGHTQTKSEMLQTVAGTEIWEIFKYSKATIHFYGSTAVVRAVADIRNGTPPQPIHDGHFNILLVLVKGPQGWQIVGEQRVHLKEKES